MTPERWREIERVCSLALDREPGERQAFVRAACARDEDLRLEVESLLRSRDRAAGFLERPALDVVARAEAREPGLWIPAETESPPPFPKGESAAAGSEPQSLPRRRAWWVWLWTIPLLVAAASLCWVVLSGPRPAGWFLRPLSDSASTVGAFVTRVEPASPAARAGFLAGDAVARADLDCFLARQQVGSIHGVTVMRSGKPTVLQLVVGPKDWAYWSSPAGRARLFCLFVAGLYLALAAVLLFQRSDDVTARWGAVLITQLGFEILLMAVQGGYLRSVPEAAEALRALPAPLTVMTVTALCLSLMAPAGAFGFCAVFPRPLPLSPAVWRWLALAAASTVFVQLNLFWLPIYWHLPSPTFVIVGGTASVVLGLGYLGWALALLRRNYRRIDDLNERRRIRIVAAGFTVTLSAFAVTVLLATPWAPLNDFASRYWVGSVEVILYAVAPVCTAYAILRHRVFDIRLIVRLGIRYAAARGVLLSLIPIAGLVLAVDVTVHRDQAVAAILSQRGGWYLALAGLAVALHVRRRNWLDSLDRQFFRERYDARRLLRAIVEDIRGAERFEDAAGPVIARVDGAIHPESIALMVRGPGDRSYRPMAAANWTLAKVDDEDRLVAEARRLNRPVEWAASDWLRADVVCRENERELWRRARVEWLFPVSFRDGGPEAFLLLGPKRSEEPYSAEDRELLEAVTSSLALLLERPLAGGPTVVGFTECAACGACWDSGASRCPNDGGELVKSPYSRTLAKRYRFDRRLGRGGMGSVYLAFDGALHREVAVKVIRSEWLASPDGFSRFRREARAAALLSHPHVVAVYDFGVADDGRAYLVMERLNGTTLREALREHGHLRPSRAGQILSGVGSAVALAHRHRLLHRDLKPENIFLHQTSDGECATVLDFGLVKPLSPTLSAGLSAVATGGLLGTFGYMSPEQLRGEPPSESWDIWSLAVVAFEMLTGRHPFPAADGPGRSFDAEVFRDAQALTPAVTTFFERAFAADRAVRPASVEGLVSRFEVAVAGLSCDF